MFLINFYWQKKIPFQIVLSLLSAHIYWFKQEYYWCLYIWGDSHEEDITTEHGKKVQETRISVKDEYRRGKRSLKQEKKKREA